MKISIEKMYDLKWLLQILVDFFAKNILRDKASYSRGNFKMFFSIKMLPKSLH